MLKCYICHDDSPNIFNQVCRCNESLLCNDCLIEINNDNNKIDNKCAICKQKLKLIYIRNSNFYKYISKYIGYSLLFFIINIAMPTFIFLKNMDVIHYGKHDDLGLFSNIFFYILLVLCITGFRETTPYLIIKYMNIHNDDKDFLYIKYNIFVSVFNIVFSLMIIFLEPDKILLLYFCFLLFVIYLIPHIIISHLFMIDRVYQNIKDLVFKYTDKRLRVIKKVENINDTLDSMDIIYQI